MHSVQIMQLDSVRILNQVVKRFRCIPVMNSDGERIGNIVGLRREGKYLVGDLECIPEEAKPFYLDTGPIERYLGVE